MGKTTKRREHPHVLIVEHEDPDDPTSEIIYDLMHPTDCPWSIEWKASQFVDEGLGYQQGEGYRYFRTYDCGVAFEQSENGTGDWPTEPGYYWMETWFETYPGGAHGPTEFDGGVRWHPVYPRLHTMLPLLPPGEEPPTCEQCNDTGLVEASDGCPPGRCGMCNDVDDGSIDRSLLLAWTMAAMFLALTWWLLWMAWR